MTLPDRFWAKVDVTDTCWVWTAGKNRGGYGRFAVTRGNVWQAHRLAYTVLVGPIPDGLDIDHLCLNPSCVNPAHLEPVTTSENTRRQAARRPVPVACPKGHPYTEANTYRAPDGVNRYCRTCNRAASRSRWRRLNWGTA